MTDLRDKAARAKAAEAKAEKLRTLLQRVSHNIGWRGTPDDDLDEDFFFCEFCGGSARSEDDITHHDECLVYEVRAALADEKERED